MVLSGFVAIPLHGYHALVVTLASPYLEVALLFVVFTTFLEGGYEKNFFFLVTVMHAQKHIIGKPFN